VSPVTPAATATSKRIERSRCQLMTARILRE
jgi:hypothetical protein